MNLVGFGERRKSKDCLSTFLAGTCIVFPGNGCGSFQTVTSKLTTKSEKSPTTISSSPRLPFRRIKKTE